MAKIYLDEVDAYLSSGICNLVSNDKEEARTLTDNITNFIDSSKTKLQGNKWNEYRENFGKLNEALKTRMSLAMKLSTAIKEALELIKDYMGEDQMLDSSDLDEYKRQREICKNSIQTLNSMLNEKMEVEIPDATGNMTKRMVPVYNSAEINTQLSLANETLTKLDRLITKIEGLDEIYNRAQQILQETFQNIEGFKNEVANITPDTTFQYVRS